MFGYVTLRTLSSGRATSTMEFSHYAKLLLRSSNNQSKRKRLIFKKMSQKGIKLKSYDHMLVDKSAEKIVKR
jgi:translation elongation factor EF-G